jgi:predicted nucleic acid-binding protein
MQEFLIHPDGYRASVRSGGAGLNSLTYLGRAATAQLCGFTVLHLDKDFELISKATGVQVEKLKISQ